MLCINSTGYTQRDRQFIQRCRRATSAGLILYAAINGILAHWRPYGLMGQVLAGLAGATIFGMFVLFAAMASRMRDEFGRALLLRSLLAGVLGTMFVVFVWGYVEVFSRTAVPQLPILFVPAILIVLTTAAKLVVFRRHRASTEEQTA